MKPALARLLEMIDGYRQALLLNYSEHDLHQLRVSVRRLRGLLRFIEGQEARKLRRKWGELISHTNVMRDWDTLANYVACLPNQDALSSLNSIIQARRQAHWQCIQRELKSAAWQRLERQTVNFLDHSGEFTQSLPAAEQTTREARARVASAWQQAKDQNSDRAWHKLRIAVKDLRYSLDTLASGSATAGVEVCKQLQELLGNWHDSEIHGALLQQLANEPGLSDRETVQSLAAELRRQGATSLALVRKIMASPESPLSLSREH